MNRRFLLTISLLTALCFCLGSCAPASTQNTQPTFSLTPHSITATSFPTGTKTPASTRTIMKTPWVTWTPSATLPLSTPVYLGTPVPQSQETIGSSNLNRLGYVAQWGRGAILGVTFAPDGSLFLVGSAFGLAVYDMHNLQAPPAWIPLEKPLDYISMTFSQDSKYLRFDIENYDDVNLKKFMTYKAFEFSTGRTIELPQDETWADLPTSASSWGDMDLLSSDGTKQLKAHTEYDQDFMDIEFTIREVYDKSSGKLLYKLPDETFYLTYNAIHQPEGCDLNNTEMCGNAMSPSAFHPYQGEFSPTGDTLTLLYRAPNYWNYNRYSLLRVYDASTGKLLDMIGNYDKPVQTFAYEPGGKRILIAFVDGSIQLWDIQKNQSTSGAWHFNDYLNYGEFTSDGRYLLLGRPDSLEVRSSSDGSLRSRYEMVSYSPSPIDPNIVAIADKNNHIKVIELDSGKTRLDIAAHEFPIFSVTYSPDGNFIASSSMDCKVKLWDARTGEFVHYFQDTIANGFMGAPPTPDPTQDIGNWGNSRIFIYFMTFIKGTRQVLGFGSWGTLVSWDIYSGATNYVVYSAPLEFYHGMMTVKPHYPESFSVDVSGGKFYIGDQSYDLQTGEKLDKNTPPSPRPDSCGSDGPVTSDGALMFTLGYDAQYGKICVLDAHDNHLIRVMDVLPAPDNDLYLAGVLLSQDGKTLLVATSMGTVQLYQAMP